MRTYSKDNGNKTVDIEINPDGTGFVTISDMDMMENDTFFEIDDIKKFINDLSVMAGLIEASKEK